MRWKPFHEKIVPLDRVSNTNGISPNVVKIYYSERKIHPINPVKTKYFWYVYLKKLIKVKIKLFLLNFSVLIYKFNTHLSTITPSLPTRIILGVLFIKVAN